ncbi:MAG: LacI family transcriptional regulator [Treponema sp.]|jgi:LacI family transcriptional regulator|nr:LacI family transcriptional regulator [Treponema sp.]
MGAAMAVKKRVTLKDIADKTGYTINTVSRALKDKKDISRETREVIHKTAGQLGYIMDSAASAMRSGKTKTIAVIVGDISNPFFGSLFRGIELSARKSGFTVIIYNTDENSEWEQNAIFSAYSKRVDGIILCPVQENSENIKLLQRMSVPFVLVGRYFKKIKTDAVFWNDVKAGELAAGYLLDQGHVNILYIGGPLHISSGADRLQGYRNAHKKREIPVKEEMIRITRITAGAGLEVIDQILGEDLPFTAVVAFSDLVAYEILCALGNYTKDKYTHIPIVGFDNIREKIMFPVYFPSIDSRENAAKICVELLLKKIQEGESHKPVLRILDVELKHT